MFNRKKLYYILYLLLIISCFFVGARGNVYEWIALIFSHGFDYAFNNPKVDWYSDNNIFLNIIILSIVPLILWFKSKRSSIVATIITLCFNVWMIAINCNCPYNNGYLVDGGYCFGNTGYGDTIHYSKLDIDSFWGKLKVDEDLFFTGIVYDNWPNGKKRLEFHVWSGFIEGYYREWNINGQLITEDIYHLNEFSGPVMRWHSNGQLKSERFYKFIKPKKKPLMLSEKCWDEKGNEIKCE